MFFKKKIKSNLKGIAIWQYVQPIRSVGRNPLMWLCLIMIGALLESGLMLALYPAIAMGLHESSPKLDAWLGYVRSLGLNDFQAIALHLVSFLILGTISSLSKWSGEAGLLEFRGHLAHTSRSILTEALRKMSWKDFLKIGSGSSIHQLSMCSERVANGGQNLLFAIASGMSALILILSMAVVSPPFALSLSCILVVGYFIQRRFTKKAEIKSASYGTESSNVGVGYAFLMQNLKYCRSSGYADCIRESANAASSRAVESYGQASFTFAIQRVFVDVCAFFTIASILFVVLFFQPITFSKATIFLGILYRFIPRLVGANMCLQNAIVELPFVQMWSKTFAMASVLKDESDGGFKTYFAKEITLKDVSYRFETENRAILENINLVFEKNTFWAIVGESGSGKSTLLDLLTGLLHSSDGTIEIDGIDIRSIDMAHWRRQIGLVLQDTPLIRGSIIENIAIFDEAPDREWAMECARIANAATFIERLPQKWDTHLGEKMSLSGGETQRLALARALYGKPSILILDEPTSALDAQSEEKFVKSLENLRGQVTILMATHRLPTIGIATDVLILDRGCIVECGKLENVLGKKESALHKLFHRSVNAA